MGESPFFAVCFRGAVCGLSAAPKAAACEKPGPSGPGHVPALPARPAAFLRRANSRIKQKTPCSEEQGVYSGCSCQARTDDIVINSHALYRLS